MVLVEYLPCALQLKVKGMSIIAVRSVFQGSFTIFTDSTIYIGCCCCQVLCKFKVDGKMYYTYLVRPNEAPEGRSPPFEPFWSRLMKFNLRGGLILQLIGVFLISTVSCIGRSYFQIFRPLFGDLEMLEKTNLPLIFVGAVIAAIGAVWIQTFRAYTDDDSSLRQPRGFRAGVKALHHASLLDLLAWTLTAVQLKSVQSFFSEAWAENRVGDQSAAVWGGSARLLHGCALVMYAAAIFLMENYHREGTLEGAGWLLGGTFKLAGIMEILAACSRPTVPALDVAFTLLYLVALVAGVAWAAAFEPLVNRGGLKLAQGSLQTEFYKAKHASAFYGPSM